MKNHNFGKFFNKTSLYLIISIVFSITATFITSPGIFFPDSYVRWSYAHMIFSGEIQGLVVWLAIVPSVIMAFFYWLGSNYAFFTLIQSWSFIFSSLLVLDKVIGQKKVSWILLLLFLNPITVCYSVFVETGVYCLTGINLLILLFVWLRKKNGLQAWQYIAIFFFCLFASYVIVGFRPNAISIIPLLLLCCLYCCSKNRKLWNGWLLSGLGIISGFLLAINTFQILNITALNSSSAGLVWEMLSTVNMISSSEEKRNYEDYLDDFIGEGTTKAALEINSQDNENVVVFFGSFPLVVMGDPQNSKLIIGKYLTLMLDIPGTFLKNKLYFTGRTLGVQQPLRNLEYGHDEPDKFEQFGIIETSKRSGWINCFNLFMQNFPIFRIPVFWFVAALLLLISSKFLLKDKTELSFWLYLLACFYYGAFIINNQSFEFRYFFPSFQLLYIIVIVHVYKLIRWLLRICPSLIKLIKKISTHLRTLE